MPDIQTVMLKVDINSEGNPSNVQFSHRIALQPTFCGQTKLN